MTLLVPTDSSEALNGPDVLQTLGISSNPPGWTAGTSPNPVSSWTVIRYTLPKSTYVTLKVYNAVGELIRTLCSEKLQPGFYRTYWDGRSNTGTRAAPGVYFYRLQTPEFRSTRKIILLTPEK